MELKNNFTNSLHMHDLLLLGVELCRDLVAGYVGQGCWKQKGYALIDSTNQNICVIRL